MSIKPFSFSLDPTPRTLLFYFAVVIQLLSVAISGLSFGLNSPIFFIAGTVVLIIWFVVIFAGALPQTDIVLRERMDQLKRGALIIFISLFVVGLLDAAVIIILIPRFIQNQNISSDFRQLMNEVEDGYRYNDASALSQQAIENLLNGQNPYAHANIVQALLKYHGTYDRVTPLRVGIFSNVFPSPTE